MNFMNCENVFSSKTLPVYQYIVNCDLLNACQRSQFTIYWYTGIVLLENTCSQLCILKAIENELRLLSKLKNSLSCEHTVTDISYRKHTCVTSSTHRQWTSSWRCKEALQ